MIQKAYEGNYLRYNHRYMPHKCLDMQIFAIIDKWGVFDNWNGLKRLFILRSCQMNLH